MKKMLASLRAAGAKTHAAWHAATHELAHWTRAVLAVLLLAGWEVLRDGLTYERLAAMGWRELAGRLAFAACGLLLAMRAGERNPTIDQIHEALAARGVVDPPTPALTSSAVPGAAVTAAPPQKEG